MPRFTSRILSEEMLHTSPTHTDTVSILDGTSILRSDLMQVGMPSSTRGTTGTPPCTSSIGSRSFFTSSVDISARVLLRSAMPEVSSMGTPSVSLVINSSDVEKPDHSGSRGLLPLAMYWSSDIPEVTLSLRDLSNSTSSKGEVTSSMFPLNLSVFHLLNLMRPPRLHPPRGGMAWLPP